MAHSRHGLPKVKQQLSSTFWDILNVEAEIEMPQLDSNIYGSKASGNNSHVLEEATVCSRRAEAGGEGKKGLLSQHQPQLMARKPIPTAGHLPMTEAHALQTKPPLTLQLLQT